MSYPSLALENQFGEVSNNFVMGGSGAINCKFTVAAADAAGFGVTGLTGLGVKSVFMHTSQTPGAGSPNPAAGLIVINLLKNYASLQSFRYGVYSPNSGTPISISSGVTATTAYVITALGTTTQAQWEAIGLPVTIPAAIGVAFIATVTGNGTGTGVVQIAKAIGAGILLMDAIGNPSLSLAPVDDSGGRIILRCLAATSSSVTTLIATAPADGTVIDLAFVLIPVPQPLI